METFILVMKAIQQTLKMTLSSIWNTAEQNVCQQGTSVLWLGTYTAILLKEASTFILPFKKACLENCGCCMSVT